MLFLRPNYDPGAAVIVRGQSDSDAVQPLSRVATTMEERLVRAKSLATRIAEKVSSEANCGNRISPAEALRAIRLEDNESDSASGSSDAEDDPSPYAEEQRARQQRRESILPSPTSPLGRRWEQYRVDRIKSKEIDTSWYSAVNSIAGAGSAKVNKRASQFAALIRQRIEFEKRAGRTISPAEAMAAIQFEADI